MSEPSRSMTAEDTRLARGAAAAVRRNGCLRLRHRHRRGRDCRARCSLTPNFLTLDNLRAILRNAATVGIVAVAMTPMTLSGNFVSLGHHPDGDGGHGRLRRR